MLNNVTSSELDAPKEDMEVTKHPALPLKPALGSHSQPPPLTGNLLGTNGYGRQTQPSPRL